GIPGVIVDGQDVAAVHAAVAGAVARARAGDGPSLLEMKTYRYRGHSRTDPGRYRPAGELDAWKQRDPVQLVERTLVERGVLSAGGGSELAQVVQAEVDQAAERAARSPFPTLEDTRSYVYAG